MQLTVVVISNTQEMGEALDVVTASSVSVTSRTVTPSLLACAIRKIKVLHPYISTLTSKFNTISLCSLATSARIDEEKSILFPLSICTDFSTACSVGVLLPGLLLRLLTLPVAAGGKKQVRLYLA